MRSGGDWRPEPLVEEPESIKNGGLYGSVSRDVLLAQ